MTNKIVLFDLDGTLVTSGGAGRIALNKALKELYGKDEICQIGFLCGWTDSDNFARAFKKATGKTAKPKDIETIHRKYVEFLPAEVKTAIKSGKYKIIKGVEKFLKTLSKFENVYIGLGTGNMKLGAEIKLKPSGLSHYFSFGGYGDKCVRRADMLKEGVKAGQKKFNIKVRPCDVYIIGDTQNDIKAAKEMDYHSGAVSCGYEPLEKLSAMCPEVLEDDFSQTASWLIWMGLTTDPKGVERGCYICPDSPIEHIHFSRTGVDKHHVKRFRKLKKHK